MRQQRDVFHTMLAASVTKAASYSGTMVDDGLDRFSELLVTLSVASAVHSDETYQFYIKTGDEIGAWDIVAFPQVASTGAKIFTARVLSNQLPENVSGASPGVAAVDPGTLLVTTAGAGQGIKTLTAGMVRHGPWGNQIGYELVITGTAPSIVFSIKVSGR